MDERIVELVGEDALTEEEARVIQVSEPYGAATEAERRRFQSAKEKLARAREKSNRLQLVGEEGAGPASELSPAHRHYLKLCAGNDSRPTHIFPRERRLVEDLAVLGLVEIGPLGAMITHEGTRAA
jgi:hypothetical protein